MSRRLDELDALRGVALGMMLLSNFVSDLDFFGAMEVAAGSGWWWFSRLTGGLFVAVAGVAAFPRMLARRMGDVPNPGSTLQSIRRGQRTEIDFLNGAVVRAAGEIGRAAPVNAALVEMVHEVESSGAFLSPATVVARVP